ncbi:MULTISPECIES: hypothetical protein [Pseudomonas syringae group]|uniref:hypothetical protein n=1 Tax=Pseudomonas syringae group TaxID=136849 RepID=UPI001605431D|nr:hypothetical protein [Pseudomonas syringae group genomosp. 3]
MQQSSSATHTNPIPQTLVWTRSVRRPYAAQPKIPKHWARYERLSFSMLGYTWGILIVTVTALHFGNYHLETKTSSTSGSHLGFHESSNAIKPDAQSAQTPALEGAKP